MQTSTLKKVLTGLVLVIVSACGQEEPKPTKNDAPQEITQNKRRTATLTLSSSIKQSIDQNSNEDGTSLIVKSDFKQSIFVQKQICIPSDLTMYQSAPKGISASEEESFFRQDIGYCYPKIDENKSVSGNTIYQSTKKSSDPISNNIVLNTKSQGFVGQPRWIKIKHLSPSYLGYGFSFQLEGIIEGAETDITTLVSKDGATGRIDKSKAEATRRIEWKFYPQLSRDRLNEISDEALRVTAEEWFESRMSDAKAPRRIKTFYNTSTKVTADEIIITYSSKNALRTQIPILELFPPEENEMHVTLSIKAND